MAWNIIWTERSKKDLQKLEKDVSRRIFFKVLEANEKELLFLEAVKGEEFYKYRVGKYRLFISKLESQHTLSVITVRHRRDAYKNL